jgi:uncharacterized membrane protein (DUF485 family)
MEVLALAIPTLGAWMLGRVMDNLFERWMRREPMSEEKWRRAKRRFHFWSAALFSAWFAVVFAIAFAGALNDGVVAAGEAAWLAIFGIGAAVMANVARIRRRRIR